MKVGTAPGQAPRGSFGRPPEMEEQIRKSQEPKEQAGGEPPAQEKPRLNQELDGFEIEDEKKIEKEVMTAVKLQKQLGIEVTEEDIQSFFFRGYFYKDISVAKALGKEIKARFKTLTGEEYQYVEELLVEDLQDKETTKLGADTLRNIYTLAFSVMAFNGKEIAKAVKVRSEDREVIDFKKTARRKKAALEKLSGEVLNRLITKNGTFTVMIRLLMSEEDNDLIKKP